MDKSLEFMVPGDTLGLAGLKNSSVFFAHLTFGRVCPNAIWNYL